jgi:predicted homoserine dehydrogenase-like protein
MTTAFTDGTKMNIENAVLCNATGLRPEVRGMHGVRTTLSQALRDCGAAFGGRGLVEYTLGGDFGGGVFVIGFGDDPVMIRPYLQYLKMGEGPHYLFFRPYHLCHMEAPLSVAEAVLDGEATIAPLGAPRAEVVAVAKRDLAPGDRLDGMGGFCVYGQIDEIGAARGLVPVGLCEGATVTRAIRRDEPLALEAVELREDQVLWPLREQQEVLLRRAA